MDTPTKDFMKGLAGALTNEADAEVITRGAVNAGTPEKIRKEIATQQVVAAVGRALMFTTDMPPSEVTTSTTLTPARAADSSRAFETAKASSGAAEPSTPERQNKALDAALGLGSP